MVPEMKHEQASRSAEGSGETGQQAARRIEIGCLLGGAREAIIVHNGEDYRLRITSRGRLILTK